MVNRMANSTRYLLLLTIILTFFLNPVSLYSDSAKEKPHGDRSKLPKGCASCHKGHAKYINNTFMLAESRQNLCFRCHADSANAEETIREGALSRNANVINIQREFSKSYHHPIEKSGSHRYGETLPETDPSMPRHAACGDCHHHHLVTKQNKMSGSIIKMKNYPPDNAFTDASFSMVAST